MHFLILRANERPCALSVAKVGTSRKSAGEPDRFGTICWTVEMPLLHLPQNSRR